MAIRRSVRERQQSQKIIEAAVGSGDPFGYLYEHMDEMACVLFDDLMYLLRAYPPIAISSHDIVDAYERHAHRDNRHSAMWWDILYLLRNKGRSEDANTVPE